MAENRLSLLKLLANETRLSIINILAKEDSYVELIASTLSMTPATVCYHLKKMEQAGLVTTSRSQFYIIYSLNRDIFDKPLRELVIQPSFQIDPDEKYRKDVIKTFFKYGKLIQIPVQRKKREIVLREIAKSFEFGKEYSEREVSEILKGFNDDFCYLRRSMIEFKFMTRDNGIYKLRGDGE